MIILVLDILQISDFGLAKWLPSQWTHHSIVPIEGTFGYIVFLFLSQVRNHLTVLKWYMIKFALL